MATAARLKYQAKERVMQNVAYTWLVANILPGIGETACSKSCTGTEAVAGTFLALESCAGCTSTSHVCEGLLMPGEDHEAASCALPGGDKVCYASPAA